MAVVSNGTTLIDNGALDSGVPTGSLILLSTQTASSSANISFTSGIDSTYDSYVFKFIDIHPQNFSKLTFNGSTDGGSNYNVTKTTTSFRAYHAEADNDSTLAYWVDGDLAQSTSFQMVNDAIGNGSDESLSGTLQIFNPSSTTFVKHFIGRTNNYYNNSGAQYSQEFYLGGYFNTTSAINAVQFKMDSGNIDDGIIKMYGVK